MWWFSVKAELASWTTYSDIPAELDNYLDTNLLTFANSALTSTLNLEKYKEGWNEFHQSLGAKILSVLKELEKHLVELKELVRVANGQFIQDKNPIEFPLRKLVDSLIKDLSAKDIYIPRKAVLTEEEIKVNGLRDMVDRDGYYLLAAPARSGKSTLMAHWINDFVSTSTIVGSKPPVKLCYYFYSKQEGTNDHNKGLTILVLTGFAGISGGGYETSTCWLIVPILWISCRCTAKFQKVKVKSSERGPLLFASSQITDER